MTMNDTWGFKSDDNNWKSTETLIRNLCDIASKGGNYLLNVGPTSEGLIPQPERRAARRSRRVDEGQRRGDLRHHRQPVQARPALGPVHEESSGDETTLYLHVFNWPGGRQAGRAAEEQGKAYLLAAKDKDLELSAGEQWPRRSRCRPRPPTRSPA